jgi:hypothetical protein
MMDGEHRTHGGDEKAYQIYFGEKIEGEIQFGRHTLTSNKKGKR